MSNIGAPGRSAPSASGGLAAPNTPSLGPPTGESRHSFHRKRWIAGAIVVVLVGAGLGIYFGTKSSGGSSAGSLFSDTSETVSVTTGTIKKSVSVSGTIEPGEDEDVNFDVAGEVNAVDVSAGQTVTRGETLATLDPAAFSDDVSAAEATLTSAEDKLTTDKDDNAVASQIDSDESSVNSAEDSLTTAKDNLADATLTSPISGTVASLDLTVGEQVSGTGGASGGGSSGASSDSADSSSGSAEIEVINTGRFIVSSDVDDTEIGSIKAGDQAVITPSGSDDSTSAHGVVTSVGLIATDEDDVATFPVSISVTGTPSDLYAGATATVAIITEQLNNITEVPTAAISYSNGSATVTEVVGGSDKTVVITTGATSGIYTQVTSGLKAGDKVIEEVVKFNRSALTKGGTKSLFGSGGGSGTHTFTGGGGGFPAGGFAGGGTAGGGTGAGGFGG
jgi:membrane fusion protein, macrolide-specific efflux system